MGRCPGYVATTSLKGVATEDTEDTEKPVFEFLCDFCVLCG